MEDCRIDILSLLDEQYRCTFQYCETTTALHNALQQREPLSSAQQPQQQHQRYNRPTSGVNHHLHKAMQNYMNALQQVQTRMASLEDLVESFKAEQEDIPTTAAHSNAIGDNNVDSSSWSTERIHEILEQHLQRSRRILSTISTSQQGASFHANGLPVVTSSTTNHSNHERLVALATLRASIQTIRDKL